MPIDPLSPRIRSSAAVREAQPAATAGPGATNTAVPATPADTFVPNPAPASSRLTGGYPPVPIELALRESMKVTNSTAELPTPAELAELKAQGKDVLIANLALREAHSLPDKTAELASRERVQGVTLSIDSYTTLDLDNAMSFRREADGSLVVGIHAVDLSAWVRAGSALDFSARRRVDTKYLEGQGLVLPMLPLSLSEGKLSLFEGQPRLTKSVEMRFSPDGTLQGTRIFRSTLVNDHRLDDADAAAAMAGQKRGAQTPPLAEALKEMSKLAARINGATDPQATMGLEKMLGFYTQLSAKIVGEALSGAGLEASYRNQPQANAKSSYGHEATGHASIGAKAYATWTGPMRRYADLDVHRSLDRLIDGRTPAGRLQQLDHDLRQAQLERGQRRDPRMDFIRDLVAVTRAPGEGEPPK